MTLPLALTMGEPAGIGGEIALKAWLRRADAPLVVGAIDAAVADVRAGRAAAVVTNPINKDALYRAGFRHPGHTEYLAELAGIGASAVMMLAGPELRVVPVTIHL